VQTFSANTDCIGISGDTVQYVILR